MIIDGHVIPNPRFGDRHALTESVTVQPLQGGESQDGSTGTSFRRSQLRVPMCLSTAKVVYNGLIAKIGTSVSVTLYGITGNVVLTDVTKEVISRATTDLVIGYSYAG